MKSSESRLVTRSVKLVLLLLWAVIAPGIALAQGSYPNKPVRLIVTTGPGTAPDVMARILARKLHEQWNQTVIVDNRAGAAGTIAAEAASRAEPDGYTLFLGTVSEMSINPHIYKSLRYDPIRDFSGVTQVGASDLALVVNPSVVNAKTLAEFESWLKGKNPVFFGTFGVGTPGHLVAGVFAEAMRTKIEPIHFKSVPDAMTGLVSGDLHGVFTSIALAGSFVKSGKLQAIAVTAPARTDVLPGTPTFRELGHPGLEVSAWFGVFSPSKTPTGLLDKLNADIVKAVTSADGKLKLEEAGFRVTGTTRQELAKAVSDDFNRWGKVVKAMQITAD